MDTITIVINPTAEAIFIIAAVIWALANALNLALDLRRWWRGRRK